MKREGEKQRVSERNIDWEMDKWHRKVKERNIDWEMDKWHRKIKERNKG